MEPSLADFPLEITCPGCRKKVSQTVGWFKREHDCPFDCGARFAANKLRREILSAEGAFERFLKALK
jgi:hypothetical protein